MSKIIKINRGALKNKIVKVRQLQHNFQRKKVLLPKKLKFSEEDEMALVNFVQSNELLYNPKHKEYRDVETRNSLWLQIAEELNMDVDVVKRKWHSMRDYFIRSKEKKPNESKGSFLEESSVIMQQQQPSKHRVKFTEEEEEKIINFIKSHEILYNIKMKGFRNFAAKNRLWMRLANDLNMDVEIVKHKWKTMRDYFIQSKVRKPKVTTETAAWSKRDASMAFLLESPHLMNRCSLSSLVTVVRPSADPETKLEHDILDINSEDDDNDLPAFEYSVLSEPTMESSKSESQVDNKALKEFSSSRPKPTDFLMENPKDDLDHFFEAMASTVRKFPITTVARLKLQFSTMVGEEEIAWAENQQRL